MAQHEQKHPKVQEPALTLSDAEQKALASLHEVLDPKGEPFNNLTDVMLMRFLRANYIDSAKAAEAVTNYVAWRKDNGVDDYKDATPEKTALIRKLAPYSYHGFDKEGRPVYFEKTGKIQCWAMSSLINEQEFINSHVVGMELIAKRCQESSEKSGRRADEFTCVFDLAGLGLGHRNVIYFLKACAEFDGKTYPNKAGKILVVNAPWCVNMLYPLIQPFLDAITKARIEVISGDIGAKLREFIDEDQLPAEYGGKCNCDGGCVAELDCSDVLAKLEGKADDGLEKMNVAAGATLEKTLSVTKDGGVVSWNFESEGGYDIEFSIELVVDGQSKLIKPATKAISDKGSFPVTTEGQVKFIWNNSYSYFTSKDLRYVISVDPIVDVSH